MKPPSRLALVCRAVEAYNRASAFRDDDELRCWGTLYGCLYALGFLPSPHMASGEELKAGLEEAKVEFPEVFRPVSGADK